jgi:hypothetical protein
MWERHKNFEDLMLRSRDRLEITICVFAKTPFFFRNMRENRNKLGLSCARLRLSLAIRLPYLEVMSM